MFCGYNCSKEKRCPDGVDVSGPHIHPWSPRCTSDATTFKADAGTCSNARYSSRWARLWFKLPDTTSLARKICVCVPVAAAGNRSVSSWTRSAPAAVHRYRVWTTCSPHSIACSTLPKNEMNGLFCVRDCQLR